MGFKSIEMKSIAIKSIFISIEIKSIFKSIEIKSTIKSIAPRDTFEILIMSVISIFENKKFLSIILIYLLSVTC